MSLDFKKAKMSKYSYCTKTKELNIFFQKYLYVIQMSTF